MKNKLCLMLILAMTVAITCFARLEHWPITQKPTISLAQAEAIGDKAIEQKYKGYFCVGARFAMLGEKDQEWELSYTNSNGGRKWVIVDGQGKTALLDTVRDL